MLLIARYAERKDEDGISRVKKQRVKKKTEKGCDGQKADGEGGRRGKNDEE